MNSFIRNLSLPAEAVLVLFLAFGFDCVYEFWLVAHARPLLIDDHWILRTVALELLKLAVILWIGRIRGWSITTFGWRITWKGVAAGVILFIAAAAAKILVNVALDGLGLVKTGGVVFSVSFPVILVLVAINPFYEEILEVAYVIKTLQRFGMWPVILASSLLRGLLHVYQGFGGFVAMFAMGMIYGLVYWRWRQLWPLVVAHAFDDFLGLLYVTHQAG